MAASRRLVRLRREYLYRKSLEGRTRDEYEKKERIRRALQEGKPIPTELRDFEAMVRHEMELEDEGHRAPKSHIDDEYASAGIRDPKVCVTTARSPSSRLRQFAKEVRLIFPNAQRINRGNSTIKEVVDACRSAEFTDIVVLQETRGEPDGMIVSHLPFGPTVWFTMSNAVLRHDIEGCGPVSEQYPHLVFHRFTTPLGDRIAKVLKFLFPTPKADSHRVITFANDADTISFRHHTYDRVARGVDAKAQASAAAAEEEEEEGADEKALEDGVRATDMRRRAFEIALTEVGPRFELRPYQIKLGTVDQTEAEVEWVLRPYMNTATKKTAM